MEKTKSREFKPLEGYVRWTPELAIEELRRFHEFFGLTSADAVQKNYHRLYKAFERNKGEPGWFPDWDSFVKAAGLGVALERTFWTRDKFLEVLKRFYNENPDAPLKEFEFRHPDAYTAFKRHKEEWGFASIKDALVCVGIQPKRREREKKPGARKPRAKQQERKPEELPQQIVVNGVELNPQKEYELLKTPGGKVRWNVALSSEVRRALLQFQEIREAVEKMGLRKD